MPEWWKKLCKNILLTKTIKEVVFDCIFYDAYQNVISLIHTILSSKLKKDKINEIFL